MEGKTDDKILLEMQNTLGRIEAMSVSMKEDIAELKQKDISQSEALEKAYAKAKARQDSIRDDLQHQIDSNKTLILTVNESISTLNKSLNEQFNVFNQGLESKFKDENTKIDKKLDEFDTRITTLETKKEKTLAKWYDKIIDKVSWLAILAALGAFFKWLNAPPEILKQLPH